GRGPGCGGGGWGGKGGGREGGCRGRIARGSQRPAALFCLAFSAKNPINPGLHRSWLGAERTVGPNSSRQDLLVRRPVLPPSEHSSLSPKGSRGLAPGSRIGI